MMDVLQLTALLGLAGEDVNEQDILDCVFWYVNTHDENARLAQARIEHEDNAPHEWCLCKLCQALKLAALRKEMWDDNMEHERTAPHEGCECKLCVALKRIDVL